jgi:DNA polymerase-1
MLFAAARQDVNIDSHTQLTAALKQLGVPVPDSTRNWKLQPLANDYPVVAKLLEYRTVQKATTSYGENILNEISRVTGRVHANFHQIGAPTGRFSCTNPNIQQVPHEPEYRRCFRAPEGRKLVIADYSQVELRILADVTGDEGFIEAFNSGADLHRVTAAQVFNVKPEDVTSEQRSFSKRLNFGVVYGIGANRFAAMTGLPISEAEEIMRRYFATYSGLNRWLREAAQKALRDREARTPLGRRARFFFDPADRQAASLAQRNGKNVPIQGASADILKRALRLLHDDLRPTTARLINIVHDEIVVEADADAAEETTEILKRAMCRAGEEYVKRVPIAVEAHVGGRVAKGLKALRAQSA